MQDTHETYQVLQSLNPGLAPDFVLQSISKPFDLQPVDVANSSNAERKTMQCSMITSGNDELILIMSMIIDNQQQHAPMNGLLDQNTLYILGEFLMDVYHAALVLQTPPPTWLHSLWTNNYYSVLLLIILGNSQCT